MDVRCSYCALVRIVWSSGKCNGSAAARLVSIIRSLRRRIKSWTKENLHRIGPSKKNILQALLKLENIEEIRQIISKENLQKQTVEDSFNTVLAED